MIAKAAFQDRHPTTPAELDVAHQTPDVGTALLPAERNCTENIRVRAALHICDGRSLPGAVSMHSRSSVMSIDLLADFLIVELFEVDEVLWTRDISRVS